MRETSRSKAEDCPEQKTEDIRKLHPCFGCFHWRGETYGGMTCNYIFDEGHRRPCPPGADCTVRTERGAQERLRIAKFRKLK